MLMFLSLFTQTSFPFPFDKILLFRFQFTLTAEKYDLLSVASIICWEETQMAYSII